MRYQGKIISWDEGRGFGFIRWNGAEDKLFVHISEFAENRRRPTEGDIVTYEVGKDASGRSQAVKVSYVISAMRNGQSEPRNPVKLWRLVAAGVVVLGIVGYFNFAPKESFRHAESALTAQQKLLIQSTQSESIGRQPAVSELGNNASDEGVLRAFSNHQSNVQVSGHGVVAKLLPDDNEGSKHQRFILRLSSGQTLLIAHNIDLAPRLNSLREGDMVEFYGQYEWNEKGGVVHWTHRDPRGSHVDGWLQYQGQKFQ